MHSELLKQITSQIPEDELDMYVRDVYSAKSPLEAINRLGLTLDEVILWWQDNSEYRMQIGEEASREIEEILRKTLQQKIYEILRAKYNQERNRKPSVQTRKSRPLQGAHNIQHKQLRRKITTNEIIAQVSGETDLEYSEVEVALKAILMAIKTHLSYGNEVQLFDFGTFRMRKGIRVTRKGVQRTIVTKPLAEKYLFISKLLEFKTLPKFKPSKTFFKRIEEQEDNQIKYK